MPVRVVLIEDAEQDPDLIVHHLRRLSALVDWWRVANVRAFEAVLRESEWDLVLHNHVASGFSPNAALQIIRERKLDLPFIVVVSALEEERHLELMDIGADDVIPRNGLERLAPTIERVLTDAALRREREHTAAALYESEIRYRAIIEDQSEMICRFLPDGTLTFANKACRDFFANGCDDLVGQSFYVLLSESNRDTVCSRLQSLSLQEPVLTHEYHVPRPDGQIGWQQWTSRAFFDANGAIESYQSVGRDITELKQTEIELREEQHRLRMIADHLPVVIAYVDKEQRYRFINSTGASWFGRDEADVTGELVKDVLGEVVYAKLLPYIEAAISGHEVTADLTIPYPAGIVRDVQLTYIPDLDDSGAVRGFFAMSVDVTERKRAAQALQESEARLAAILENAIEAIVSVDEEQHICLFNKGAEAIFGYRAEEVLRRPLHTLIPEEHRGSHWAHVKEFPASSDNRRRMAEPRQMTGLRKDGSVFSAEVTLSKVKLAGQVITTAMLHDITERKKAEDELQNSERKYRKILNSTSEGYWLIDTELQTIDVNPALCEILGYARENLIGKSPLDFVSEHHREEHQRRFQEIPKSKQRSFETVLKHRSGRDIYAHVVATTLLDEFDQYFGSFALVRDESDRKRTEEQLHQAQKMEAIGQLTGGIAHDFNNLLSVIIGNLQLLERALKDDDRLSRRIDMALQATARGAELTSRLLAFSRRQVLEPKTLFGNDLVSGVTDMLSRALGETIKIECNMATDPWSVRVDPGQLESTLLNLAINARDAMPDGGRLTIETENVTLDEAYQGQHSYVAPGDYVGFTVSDTGSGMPKDVLEHAFEPFFTTKGVGKGTGLGLSMVYGFVKQSGGSLEIQSEVGRGTNVTIYLPRIEDAEAGDQAAPALIDEQGGGSETILVVEDEPQVRETAVTVLRDLGYCVLQAKDGLTALAVLEREPTVDLLFTDVVMPGSIDGLALAREVKRRRPGIGVLYTSGYTDHAAMNSDSPDDCGHWLGKPYPRQHLATKVREALSGRSGT